jgi:amino acid transporter
MGSGARSLLLAGAVISMFGYLGGMTLSMPRMVYAFARDGFLPRALAAVDPRHHVPQAAIVAQSTVTVALAATGTFEGLAILANVAGLALYFGCALAAWRLRRLGVTSGEGVPYTLPLSAAAPWLACIVILWLFTGLTRNEWLAFGGSVAAATVIYLLATRRRRGVEGAK